MQLFLIADAANYRIDKPTDLCAERCCRNSETGSAMNVSPKQVVILRYARTTTTTVKHRPRLYDDYCTAACM